ncbi:MAG TPA: phage holin family protein [Pseudonocardiaceae bacterium]|nr:phage holin family protein [Pseudonocardiaceae bacterium]
MTCVTSAHHTNGTRSGNGLPPVSSIPLTEDDPARDAENQSLGALVRDATTHLSTLVRAEVELARSEITAEVKQGVRGSLFFVIALTLALLLMPFLLVTIALVISLWLPQWAGFGIVTGFMVLVALACAFLGWRRVRKLKGPRQTISSVRDTAAALKPHRDADQPH